VVVLVDGNTYILLVMDFVKKKRRTKITRNFDSDIVRAASLATQPHMPPSRTRSIDSECVGAGNRHRSDRRDVTTQILVVAASK